MMNVNGLGLRNLFFCSFETRPAFGLLNSKSFTSQTVSLPVFLPSPKLAGLGSAIQTLYF